jgi:hypothetical protein
MRARSAALVVAASCTVAACASGTSGQHATSVQQPTATPTPPSTSQSTVTVTVAPPTTSTTPTPVPTPAPKATPPPQPTTTPPPAAPTPPPPAPATVTPATVVTEFYDAVNAQDYASAWELGGSNLGSSYDSFARGFAGTVHDTLIITGAQGDTVQVHLEALEDNGSTKIYDGSYTVHNGVITQGRLTQAATLPPPGSIAPSTIIKAPNGDFYSRGEYCPDADAGRTTQDAEGHTLTCVFESGRFHWH